MRRLFIIICGLLIYGSLYPWEFQFSGSLWLALLRVFHQWPSPLTFPILKDMALNVVVYAPLGLTGYLSSETGFRWTRACWPVAFGFVLSLGLETLQSFLPGRVPSGMDLLCNTLGAAAGVGIAAAYESALARWFERLNRSAMRPSSALMMLIIWAGHYLMPLTVNALKLMSTSYESPVLERRSWIALGNSAATWLLAGRFAEAVAGKQKWAFPAAVAALLLAAATRAVSPNLLFTGPMLVGAIIGLAVWRMLEGRGYERLYAALALAWVVGDGLRPYTFVAHQPFDWIPFRGLLGVDWTNGVTSLLSKAWMYGSVFWTWERAGIPRGQAMTALLAVLAGIEYSQMYLPARVSTMTDIAMGAIAAGLLWSVERKYSAPAGDMRK